MLSVKSVAARAFPHDGVVASFLVNAAIPRLLLRRLAAFVVGCPAWSVPMWLTLHLSKDYHGECQDHFMIMPAVLRMPTCLHYWRSVLLARQEELIRSLR